LFAAALVIELINVSGASPFAAGRPFILAVVGGLALSALGRLLLGDRDRGGIFAALWVLAFLGSEDLRLSLAVLAATVLLFIERYAIADERRRIPWSRVGRVATGIVAILTIAVGIQAVQLGSLEDGVRSVMHETPLRPTTATAPASSTDPDIYMLLLDGHTRADVLGTVFDHDETPVLDALAADGFTVASKSRSNYTQTAETLTSMFTGTHLFDLDEMEDLLDQTEDEPPGGIVRGLINDNRTWGFLRDRGYQVDAVSSGFEQVAIREADRFVDTGQLNEFEEAVLKRSLLGHLIRWLAPDAVSAQQRSRIEGVFDEFATAPSWIGAGPQFVFAHVPSPHPPWVFHADGSPRTVAFDEQWLAETPSLTGLSVDELERGYADQVTDVDRRLLEALPRLDAAIAARGRPAVVIVFSDHGTWIGADGGDIRLRFKNLLAIRAAGTKLELPSNETLVNLIPDLFDQLFDAGWARQADTQFRFGTESAFELYPVDDPDASPSP